MKIRIECSYIFLDTSDETAVYIDIIIVRNKIKRISLIMNMNNRLIALTDYIDDFTELEISNYYGYAINGIIWTFKRRLPN